MFQKFDYAAFIEEAHHSRKRDAPSGTALRLRDIVSEAYGSDVPVASTRAGHIPGTHRVGFDSAAEPVRMLSVEGFEREVVRFTTDIPYLAGWGRPLLLGPGSILDAHTDGERVSKRELEESVELYVRLARTLLAGAQAQGAGE